MSGVILAVGGLAHIILDHGRVYRLEKRAGGDWKVEPLAELPSTPFEVGVLDEDHLAINTEGGAVAVDGKGMVEALDCLQ